MHYLVLGIGLLISVYVLYRFFLNANVKQIKAAFLVAATAAFGTALFYMAISGRLPAALALLVALIPFVMGYFKEERDDDEDEYEYYDELPEVGSPEEALEILGLKEGADETEIKAAYKKLMQKVHPDNEGSDWMAAKLNQARDILLK